MMVRCEEHERGRQTHKRLNRVPRPCSGLRTSSHKRAQTSVTDDEFGCCTSLQTFVQQQHHKSRSLTPRALARVITKNTPSRDRVCGGELNRVAFEARDCESLHESCDIRHDKDQASLEEKPGRTSTKGGANLVKGHVRQRVVKAEVKVGREKHRYGHSVDIPAAKRVRGPQDIVEVVCIPVVADDAEDSDPHVRLEAVPLKQRLALVQCHRWREHRLQHKRQHQTSAHYEEGDLCELQVDLGADDECEARDPEASVRHKPNLSRPLGCIGLRVCQPPREGGVLVARKEEGERGEDRNHAPDHAKDVVQRLVCQQKLLHIADNSHSASNKPGTTVIGKKTDL
mmetsp:Transcript_11812/g.29552  ORF Transcript_11812/g.29552 Transcript_11812/m.29552 type:complete len:342 (-) Transcript_11812:54-1079(-)